MVPYLRSSIPRAFAALQFLIFALAALQNTTIDDQDFKKINYTRSSDWQHDPLIRWEHLFHNRSRSYTYVPGASASFSFTGTGVYLQGPSADDQALRRVTLDGQDMGVFSAYATSRRASKVFWGQNGLANTSHTVVVTHIDTATKLLVMDAWIVELTIEQLLTDPPPSTSSRPTSSAAAALCSIKYESPVFILIPPSLFLILANHWI